MAHDYATNPRLSQLLVSCLSEWGITTLTEVQELAVAADVSMGASAIVCAPTSSGKTLVGELALANALSNGLDALYLVSHKALAEQKYSDFTDRFSTGSWAQDVTVGISTGDREEGDVNCRLLISTYEKALGLLLSGRLKPSKTVVIADELQLLGEVGRGAAVETLCALLRQRQPQQFVGLTATVENPEELAAWMQCKAVRSSRRDVALIQTIRYGGKLYTVEFGQEEGETTADPAADSDLHELIRKAIGANLGPVLVFTETRREASELASEYSEHCQRAATGITISKQLELFSEPTESSQLLMSHAERRVAFHTADLTPDERTVIESGFTSDSFDACFATSTLAAGVNFPFRTVIFPKLTYGFGEREGKLFSRSDFRNMSGRAGRLGHHDDGRVILLPKNSVELKHAMQLVSPENDRVASQLVKLSMRRTVLSLVAARVVSSKAELSTFFENTFYWHQTLEHNPKQLEAIIAKANKAINWLLENRFVEESQSTLLATPLGKCTSLSGLLPETIKQFLELVKTRASQMLANFAGYEVALIHWVASCSEFAGDTASRFLPYPSGQMKPESSAYMQKVPHLTPWDRTNDQVTRCTHALGLFIQGEAERKIRFVTGISSGNLHRLSTDISWVIDGLCCVSGSADAGLPQPFTNYVGMLARRVRWGTPVEAIDVLRLASRHRVPGFGRQRVMALFSNGLQTIGDIIGAGRSQLAKLLGAEQRADALIAALSDKCDESYGHFQRLHVQLGREIGVDQLVTRCNSALGTDYDDAIFQLLKEEMNWVVDKLDDGKRQNVPDIQLTMGSVCLLIECKTVMKKPPLIAKEEAFAVLQKAVDYDSRMKRITLGKPDFDEHSKKKAAASSAVTLVRHGVFMEGVMRVLTGRLAANDFVAWLAEPGVTDLSRLPGTPTFAEPDVAHA